MLVELETRKSMNRIYGKFLILALMAILILNNFVGASNISLNLGQTTEFGQGLVLTTTCDTHITAKISREFDVTDNTFYVKDLTIGDISTKLHSKRVTLALRNDSTNSNLTSTNLYFDLDENGIVFTSPLAHADVINYSTSSNFGQNEIGISSITFTNVRNANGSKIPTDDVSRVLLETSKGGGCTAPTINCATVTSTCEVGSTGPGGGVVFYVSPTTFSAPPLTTRYKYIEAAPSFWVTGVKDPQARLCVDNNNVSGVLSEEIGYSVSNTNSYIAEADCTGTTGSSSTPAGLAKVVSVIRAYDNPFISGTSDVGTWNLPTLKEMIALCKVARFGSALASTKTNCSDSGGALDTNNWMSDKEYVTSSKPIGGGWSTYINLSTGTFNNSSAVQTFIGYFRPIRYFN